jgi:hypothetical protein
MNYTVLIAPPTHIPDEAETAASSWLFVVIYAVMFIITCLWIWEKSRLFKFGREKDVKTDQKNKKR